MTLHKTQTGIAGELQAARELARRGFNVIPTFGNAEEIDLIAEKEGIIIPFQVKSIQRKESICWSINLSNLNRLKNVNTFFPEIKAKFKSSLKEITGPLED